MSAELKNADVRADEARELALEVLENVRATLMVSYRFLDRALWKMPFRENDPLELIGTDGNVVGFNTTRTLERYRASADELVRDYLHMIVHCILYHPFVGNGVNPNMWDIACDIAVERACLGIASKRFPSAYDAKRAKVVKALEGKLGNLSAEKIYNHIISTGVKPQEAELLKALFIRDDHGMWYHDRNPVKTDDESDADTKSAAQQPNDSSGGQNDDDRDPDDADDQGGFGTGESGGFGHRRTDGTDAPNTDGLPDEHPEEAQGAKQEPDDPHFENPADDAFEDGPNGDGKQEWADISKQVKVDLETRSKHYGNDAGAMIQALRVANRRRQDYRSFLKRFAQLDEEMTVNDDEFDLVYYSYGLRRYGNMPLIEPLEYKESKKVRDFVVAIDTSGSVEGALVRRFVEETFALLKNTESFFSEVHIRIMQCDARVQSDVLVTSAEEFQRYMEHFEIKGFGGTDFRPVFARVDERMQNGEFENLRGLIYFTDGYGTYPRIPPEYETVFVFADSGYSGADVPPWAMRLFLDCADLET